MMSFGRQFDFHDIIYHVKPCNVDNRRCYTLILQLSDLQNICKNTCFSPNKSFGMSKALEDGGIVIDSEGFVLNGSLSYFSSFCVLESK